MNTAWKILDVSADGELITAARYFVSASDAKNTVETEGNWYFQEPKLTVPFSDVTEEMVIDWVKTQAGSSIEARLKEQLQALKKQTQTVLPWLPQVFTPEFKE